MTQRARHLMAALSDNPEMRDLGARLALMLAVRDCLARGWPDLPLTPVSVRDGVLRLATPNAALAAKCRQSAPSILLAVRRVYPEVEEVRFSARPQATLPVAAPSDRPRELSAETLEKLQYAASELPDGPVRAALQRMVRRRLG